ncbi:MAG: hypothetical protein HDS14_00545 [Bacteroides sp.]|nr:hypothetical protein [Bacteroides sp.]
MNYIKANPKVVARLGLTEARVPFPDGNYLLHYKDLTGLGLGGYNVYDEVCRKVGAVIIDHKQAYSEQHGGAPLPLPEAELEEYRVPMQEDSSKEDENTEEAVKEEPVDSTELSDESTEKGGQP